MHFSCSDRNVVVKKFSEVLDMCQQLIFDAMKQGDSDRIFKLLDPPVSDNQCHIHSLLILRGCPETSKRL